MTCRLCQLEKPTVPVEFNQNTGCVFVRYHRTVKGDLCRGCIKHVFTRFTLHNLFLGWWGSISFFATLYFMASNTVHFVRGMWALRPSLSNMPVDQPTPDYRPFGDVR
jgi:hypothetical protein